jgi:hypothetical protein
MLSSFPNHVFYQKENNTIKKSTTFPFITSVWLIYKFMGYLEFGLSKHWLQTKVAVGGNQPI